MGCSVSRAYKTWSRSFLIKDFPVHTNPDIFEIAYFVTRFRVDGTLLNHSGERFQKDTDSERGFASFVRAWPWETGFVANNNCKLSLAGDCSFTFGNRFLSITTRNMQSFGIY